MAVTESGELAERMCSLSLHGLSHDAGHRQRKRQHTEDRGELPQRLHARHGHQDTDKHNAYARVPGDLRVRLVGPLLPFESVVAVRRR